LHFARDSYLYHGTQIYESGTFEEQLKQEYLADGTHLCPEWPTSLLAFFDGNIAHLLLHYCTKKSNCLHVLSGIKEIAVMLCLRNPGSCLYEDYALCCRSFDQL
jgi:hypothetical protein